MKRSLRSVALAILLAGTLLPMEARATSSAWEPFGDPILDGPTDTSLGWAVDIDDVGDTIAVSAPLADDNRGEVRVLDWVDAEHDWVQRGEALTGDEPGSADLEGVPGDLMGISIDLTADGNTIVVSAPVSNDRAGTIRVYDWNDPEETWEQRGDDILGEVGDLFGWTVAVSDDGDTLISGSLGDAFGLGFGNSSVSIFQWDDDAGTWGQRGSDLNSDADLFTGWSVAISDDGDTIAFNGINLETGGLISVYDWDEAAVPEPDWSIRGSLVDGGGAPYIALSLNMSGDGRTIAAGFTDLFGDVQVVGVFDWDSDEEQWALRGDILDITGLNYLFFFTRAISMNSDGTTVVVDSLFDESGEDPGSVVAYDWTDGGWSTRTLLDEGRRYAFSTAINADATRAVVGESFNSDETPDGAVVYQWGPRTRTTRPSMRITLDPAGGQCDGSTSTQTLRFRRHFSLPDGAECTRDGFAFLGWTRDPGETNNLVTGRIRSSENLTAVWGELPAAPSTINVLANFLCRQNCDSALIVWSASSTSTETPIVAIDGTEIGCTSQGEVFGLKWCLTSGLAPGSSHTASVAWRNQHGVGPAISSFFDLL